MRSPLTGLMVKDIFDDSPGFKSLLSITETNWGRGELTEVSFSGLLPLLVNTREALAVSLTLTFPRLSCFGLIRISSTTVPWMVRVEVGDLKSFVFTAIVF